MSERNQGDSFEIPPEDMPRDFVYKKKRYNWYNSLNDDQKREMIQIYRNWEEHIHPIREELKKLEKDFVFKLRGIFLMKWDERVGPISLGKYPTDLELQNSSLMQIYANHFSTKPTSVLSLGVRGKVMVSYPCDVEKELYLIVVSENLDVPEKLEKGIKALCSMLKENVPTKTMDESELKNLFNVL